MNPLNPSHNPFEEKIQKEYTFEDTHSMSNFVHRISRNPGIKSVDLKGKHSINVSFMNQGAVSSTDSLYTESYEPVEEKVDKDWWDKETKKYDAKYGEGKPGDDTAAMKARRKAKMDKIASDEREVKSRKQREIERARDAESKRKGDEAKKKRREEEGRRKDQEKSLTTVKKESNSWIDNALPDLTAALEEVQKKNLSEATQAVVSFKNDAAGAAAVGSETSRTGLLVGGKKVKDGKYRLTFKDDRMKDKFMQKYASKLGESTELSEMDPKEHVKKDEKTGMYCVYNKDGKKVKEFKSQEDANKYATDNHDSLMEYGSPMKPGKPRTANQPLVKTGQGDYERTIRPSDLLKKMKKKKKR